jgi:hypothetical protein
VTKIGLEEWPEDFLGEVPLNLDDFMREAYL